MTFVLAWKPQPPEAPSELTSCGGTARGEVGIAKTIISTRARPHPDIGKGTGATGIRGLGTFGFGGATSTCRIRRRVLLIWRYYIDSAGIYI